MNPVKLLRARTGLTQAKLAELAETSQPTIAAYEAGTKTPNLRTLERLARAAGLELAVDFVPPLTREDRRSLALHEAVVGHLLESPDTVVARARKTLGRMQQRHPHAWPLLDEWKVLLRLPIPHLVDILRDPGPRARELRHTSPFAGVLSAAERTQVLKGFAIAEGRRPEEQEV